MCCKKWGKRTLKFLLFVLLFFGVERFCRKETGGLRFAKTYAESNNPSWKNSSSNEEIEKILSGPFYFLGKGVQSYAFVSQDGKTVLKLFKHYHMWPSTTLLKKVHLPIFDGIREKTIQERERRMAFIFTSCKIALENENMTGVFFAQLNPGEEKRIVSFFDKLGIEHRIDLAKTPFILQRKAEPICEKIAKQMDEGRVDEAKNSIHSLLALVKERSDKGILNTDRRILQNIGYMEDAPIHIDIGSFANSFDLHKRPIDRQDIVQETIELKQWLEKKYPELLTYYENCFEENFSSLR